MARKLGRPTAHRRADLRGMVTSLFEHGRIQTTFTRAKEVAPLAERMITVGKTGTLAARRRALGYITKEDVVTKLFSEIAPSFSDRNGGYTRIMRTGPRRGDAAEMAILELVNYELPKQDTGRRNRNAKYTEDRQGAPGHGSGSFAIS